MAKFKTDPHFQNFATVVEREIAKYEKSDEKTLLAAQVKQLRVLMSLEDELRQTLIEHKLGIGIYKKFHKFICEEKRNILAARPYFRERQTVFTKEISTALKAKDYQKLQEFHFNWQFINFLLNNFEWKPKSQVYVLCKKIKDIREEIIVTNLPLAISRARIFYRKIPESHLSFMDLISICVDGLCSGVDKYVMRPGITSTHRSVYIGRMVGDLIQSVSQTQLHFYPSHRRLLYRSNKELSRNPTIDFKSLTKKINVGLKGNQKASSSEVAGIVAASTLLSFSNKVPEGTTTDGEQVIADLVSQYEADNNTRPDVMAEDSETQAVLKKSIEELTIFQQKILKLKGIDF